MPFRGTTFIPTNEIAAEILGGPLSGGPAFERVQPAGRPAAGTIARPTILAPAALPLLPAQGDLI